MDGTVLCAANHVPLTPMSFLERAVLVYPNRLAIVAASGLGGAPARTCAKLGRAAPASPALSPDSASRATTWSLYSRKTFLRCASSTSASPWPAPSSARSTRALTPPWRRSCCSTRVAKVIFVHYALLDVAKEALSLWPADENEPIALNYTSGTTSRPKGVVYSHRGAYLNSVVTVLMKDMVGTPVYLWTVPMFHCNGWCLVWGVAAKGGTNVCLRKVTAAAIFDSIARQGVTHMGGAPTVLSMIVNAAAEERKPLPGGRPVTVKAGGAPPPPQVLLRMEALGFLVIHGYGLTETYGPATFCAWKPEWDALPPEQQASIKSRQGLHHLGLVVDVKDPVTMRSVPADGRTMGEVMLRGNTLMSGYYKDAAATSEALAGGWLRSGDLAVRHGDGYVKIMDRSKDIIISGGENISRIEVEAALFAHPAVAEAAVVGRPDEYWGETPCAFVKLRDGGAGSVGAEEVIAFCRARLPRYMAPRTVVFVAELPKTATGKVQKVALRERARAMGSIPGSISRQQLGVSESESGTRSKL
ncbi:putative acyl-activating enzyme 1, peroxisomal [Panicum miliaceum]|uniref:4-coumarate--CoA ligase n=1 Tax=Panicum miliaceum TaxID=4540 RepID=A0A3L6S1Q9_PANMI|nr:putative acyl-activating enzyme 1, peroxisomal [Panicum miliaceum]